MAELENNINCMQLRPAYDLLIRINAVRPKSQQCVQIPSGSKFSILRVTGQCVAKRTSLQSAINVMTRLLLIFAIFSSVAAQEMRLPSQRIFD